MIRICAIFLVSGGAGLIYQIVWIRAFGNVFGNTVESAALVTAVFMLGLGVGSLLAGTWADRHHDAEGVGPLRMYGYFELAIALLGLLIALLLPHLEVIAVFTSSYVVDDRGWHVLSGGTYLGRYLTAGLLLLPVTTLMGGTLTLLIRHLLRHSISEAGWRIGALYGINTAGAAIGCIATDFLLIPNFGLFATQTVAVSLNLVAALAALRMAPRADVGAPPTEAAALGASQSGGAAVKFLAVAIAVSGFVGMGLEIVWFRHLIATMGSFRSVLSLLLGVILVGIWLGSFLAGWLERRVGRPTLLFAAAQSAFVCLSIALLSGVSSHGHVIDATVWRNASGAERGLYEVWLILRPILSLVAGPAVLMGASYPLANACVQRVHASVGRRAGMLYLANTIGAVCGSLLVGFVLLPRLGTQGSVTALCVVTFVGLFSAMGAALKEQQRSRLVVLGICGATGLLVSATFFWILQPADYLLTKAKVTGRHPREDAVTISEGVLETIAVVQVGEGRALFTNGHAMSANNVGAQRYMRSFAHVPLLALEDPKTALVICFGVGNTASSAAMHDLRLDVVDLSSHVLEHGHYFDTNNGVLDQDTTRVFVNDGRHHLRMQEPGSYDLITLEPPPIAFAGVSALYSVEFYQLARSRLAPGGYATQWLPADQVHYGTNLAIIRAFIDVFPASVLLSGHRRHLMLMGVQGDQIQIDPDLVARRIETSTAVRDDLKRIVIDDVTDLVGMFAANGDTLRRATEGVPPITDDYPLMEYSVRVTFRETEIPGTIFDTRKIATWCPSCFEDGVVSPSVAGLAELLTAQQLIYTSDWFRKTSYPPAPGKRVIRLPNHPALPKAFEQSRYLRMTYR